MVLVKIRGNRKTFHWSFMKFQESRSSILPTFVISKDEHRFVVEISSKLIDFCEKFIVMIVLNMPCNRRFYSSLPAEDSPPCVGTSLCAQFTLSGRHLNGYQFPELRNGVFEGTTESLNHFHCGPRWGMWGSKTYVKREKVVGVVYFHEGARLESTIVEKHYCAE